MILPLEIENIILDYVADLDLYDKKQKVLAHLLDYYKRFHSDIEYIERYCFICKRSYLYVYYPFPRIEKLYETHKLNLMLR